MNRFVYLGRHEKVIIRLDSIQSISQLGDTVMIRLQDGTTLQVDEEISDIWDQIEKEINIAR